MRSVATVLLFFLSPPSVFASGLTAADLVGEYSLNGNGGFLSYDLAFNTDGTVSLAQKTLDGSDIACHGVYSMDTATQDLTSVFNCDTGEVLTQEASLQRVTYQKLLVGVDLSVHIKSSLGSDSAVIMRMKKK